MRKCPGDLEEWLVTLGSFLVDGTLLVGVLRGLHQFGSRIGEWLLDVYSEKRRLSWVVMGVACWMVLFAAAGCVEPIHRFAQDTLARLCWDVTVGVKGREGTGRRVCLQVLW